MEEHENSQNNAEYYFYKGVDLDDLGKKSRQLSGMMKPSRWIQMIPIITVEAMECYDKAIQIAPNDFTAYCNKAVALSSLGRKNEAIEYCDEAIQINLNRAH